MKFDELNIDERILRAIEDMGFEETSPIQTQAIPAVCEGIDVVGQAQTGTGKTAAYTIPMLMKIDPQIKKPQAIVLCPLTFSGITAMLFFAIISVTSS